MKIKSFYIPDELINKAVVFLNKSFTANDLKNELEKLGVPEYYETDYISIQAASRIIQKLKKENRIKNIYGGGGNTLWKFK